MLDYVRVKAAQLNAGSLIGELPVDLGWLLLVGLVPCLEFLPQDLDPRYALVQALPRHDVDADLRDVQPAPVLGRVVDLELPRDPARLVWWKCLVQGAGRMGEIGFSFFD